MRANNKIAIIVASSIYNQKGLFNAVHNRTQYLKKIAHYDIDVYLLSTYKSKFVMFLKGGKPKQRPNSYEKDGIHYNILWRQNSIIDYVLYHKLHRGEYFHDRYDRKIASMFKDYDLLDVHSGASNLALQVKKKFGVPFVITWHGSDIHTIPFNGEKQFVKTKELIDSASCNFFVSRGLLEIANRITNNFSYELLYNGANELFYKYSVQERYQLRKDFGVNGSKVVAFIGNVIDVKNPLSLPPIFKNVMNKYSSDVIFWVIGDGVLRNKLENLFLKEKVECVFWGNQPIEMIPKLLQCIDVVVLPSLNEGFGMVLVEAIKCGANAVSSKVGGTSEILGDEDTFNLSDNFIEKISSRIVYYLDNNIKQSLDERFSWETTASIENSIIMKILHKQL